jgi:hypothetical protein
MITELTQQITQKEQELNNLKEQYNTEITAEKEKVLKSKSEGMTKTLYLLSFDFESSTTRTPQYLEFCRVFKKEFKAVLKPYCKEILIHKPNHFDISGFFKLNDDRIFYFSISDLRWSKENMLIRTAENFKDYSGGSNNNINLDKNFKDNLFNFLNI